MLCARAAADTREEVIFTAALFDEEEPELRLAANPWLERVLLAQGLGAAADDALAAVAVSPAEAGEPATPLAAEELSAWEATWRGRRDPAAVFDEFFLSDPRRSAPPSRLAAVMIERGVQDPAEFWFGAVLEMKRVEWEPFVRQHWTLAPAEIGPPPVWRRRSRGAPVQGIFAEKPEPAAARAKLAQALAAWRDRRPRDRYWDSFQAELSELARGLLEQVLALPSRPPLCGGRGGAAAGGDGPADRRRPVRRCADGWTSLLLDRPSWEEGAGGHRGFQDGGRREALGRPDGAGRIVAAGGRVSRGERFRGGGGWAHLDARRPGQAGRRPAWCWNSAEAAQRALAQLELHLATGRYGALTADRTDYSSGFEWPLACAPVPHAILERKFTATFGAIGIPAEEAADE